MATSRRGKNGARAGDTQTLRGLVTDPSHRASSSERESLQASSPSNA